MISVTFYVFIDHLYNFLCKLFKFFWFLIRFLFLSVEVLCTGLTWLLIHCKTFPLACNLISTLLIIIFNEQKCAVLMKYNLAIFLPLFFLIFDHFVSSDSFAFPHIFQKQSFSDPKTKVCCQGHRHILLKLLFGIFGVLFFFIPM